MSKATPTSGIVSLRLTPTERQLVEDAAAKRRWKTAHFLRVSALERAAQVLNLSRPTSFDFSGVAKRLADALVGRREVEIGDCGAGDSVGWFGTGPLQSPAFGNLGVEDLFVKDFRAKALTTSELSEMQKAFRLGGLDFAEQLLVECRRLVNASDDPDLPPPIDPMSLGIPQKDAE